MGNAIVIFRMGSLGDTVIALPCFNLIACRYPDSRRVVLTNFPVASNAAPLLSVLGEESGLAHGAISYPIGLRSPLLLFRLAKQLREIEADTVVYLMPNRGFLAAWRDWLFLKFAGFRSIVGFPYSSDMRLNRIIPENGEIEPEASRLVRCLANLGSIDLNDHKVWDLRLTEAEIRDGHSILEPFQGRPFIALNMGGKALEKDWGVDNWLALMSRLKDDFGQLGLLAVGATVDSDRAAALFNTWKGPCVNGCGRLSPRASAAALSSAQLFIGHDSGPMHLAAATGIPVLGLFGDYNEPKKWHPIGRHVSVIHNMQGMRAITVAEVETAVRGILATVQ